MARLLSFTLACLTIAVVFVQPADAKTVRVRFWSPDQLICVNRSVPAGMSEPEAAVRALAAGPTKAEAASGVISKIPAGAAITKLSISDTTAEIELSPQVLNGLSESTMLDIYDQFRTTLSDYPSIMTVKLMCKGRLLSTYLPPTPSVEPSPQTQNAPGIQAVTASSATALSGHSVCIGPSHGRFWNGSGWYWQRSDPCGFGEAVLEDTNSIRLCQFLKQYLVQDGCRVECSRQLDETDCCNSDTGMPWWKMCAQSWLHHVGAPCSVWGTYTGNCGADTAADRSNDDIRARPLYSDYTSTDINLACHTNAGGGGTATGTETYHDTAMEHPTWESASTTLATQIQNNVVAAIRDLYDGGWASRGVKDSAGGFGEIRIPNRPAALIELAFHDDCTKDALYLTDDFFRSVAEWGLYKGICAYFGVVPTWDKYSCEYVGDTIPSTMSPGQSYSVTITYRNRGVSWYTSRGFRLGEPNGSDPFTGSTRFDISGEVKPGATYTFNFMLTAPTTPGSYATHWQMVRDGYAWFGPAVNKTITVGTGIIDPPDDTGSALPAKTVDWQSTVPNYVSSGWVTNSATCGYTVYYSYTENSACTNFNREAKWLSGMTYSGRGHWTTDVQIPCNYATVNARYTLLKYDGTDEGTTVWMDQCPRSGWYNLLDADKQDLSVGGWRIHTADTSAGSGCNANCGYKMLGAAGMHIYGDRWQYINDWTCLGPFATGNPGAVSDNPTGINEANLYLYPAVDTSHGGGLSYAGVAAGRVTTGDCNNADSLNFAAGGNAAAYGGGDYRNSYGFAWIYSPGSPSPKFDIGSDDGNRAWVNGTLVNDNNSFRGLTRDQDVTANVSLPAGWSRVLFKVHNGSGGFAGTVSLRSGSDNKWNETGVNVYDLGGYLSYGLGYEQDAWYPHMDVALFDGGGDPQPGDDVYTNNTTVTASGTAWATGPVPLWKVMHYESGYGISGDTDYADVTSSGATWSHTQTGVTGHRRFSFFAVSQSHRTSFQSGPNSGKLGGSNWADGGPGSYMDVFVDNVAPLAPSLSRAAAASTSQIDLAWSIPLDQGVGVGPGAIEYASTGGDNAFRAGDVGVSVRRNGTPIYGWGTDTLASDTGLAANTAYTYDIAARDNSSGLRGSWNNATAYGGSLARWTLSVGPTTSNVTCDKPVGVPQSTADFTFTAVGGFGAGTLDHYLYAWDTSPTHTFNGSESSWSSGQLALTASSPGDWYLHVQGINGEGVANGTLDLGPYTYGEPPTVATIALALAMDDTPTRIKLASKPVTASMTGAFWLEELDRSAAIKVVSATTVPAGHLADVTGQLGPSGDQRALIADTVVDLGEGAVPLPVMMLTNRLGGAERNMWTPGVSFVPGINNIGLLVKLSGNVTYFDESNPNARYFYLDDGGAISDGSGHLGVKVLCGAYSLPTTSHVVVTGIVANEIAGVNLVPRIIVTNANSIRSF